MDTSNLKNTSQLDNQDDYAEDFQPLQQSIKVNDKQSKKEQSNEFVNENQLIDNKNQFEEYEQQNSKNMLYNEILNESGIKQRNKKYHQLLNEGTEEVSESRNLKQQNNKQVKKEDNEKVKDEDRESRIKDTIERITKNIIFSKQSIVEDITSINQYYQQNQKSIKDQFSSGVKLKMSGIYQPGRSAIKQQSQAQVQKLNRKQINEEENKIAKLELAEKIKKIKSEEKEKKMKEIERRRNKQIYEQQKQARKQQEMILKNQTRAKKNELQKRIIYEQKFISRRSVSPQIPISNEEIKAFQDAFIQHIKQRLNIGKVKNKGKSLQKQEQNRRALMAEEQKKNFNKKIHKGEKLKQKIILNLKQKIQKQLQPTYESIIADSKEIEDLQLSQERKRGHQSAPQLRLPQVSPRKPLRRTFYSKQQPGQQRVHVLKLSDY